MPTSATGNASSDHVTSEHCNRGVHQRGFSLLELLVALMVVVLLTSLVTLNVGSGGRELVLESQLRDLSGTAEFALDEAQLLGIDHGLVLFTESDTAGEIRYGYRWHELRPDGWRQARQGIEAFSPGRFPRHVELQLELEGATVGDFSSQAGDEPVEPQIVFFASGEVSAGALDVRHRESGELLWRLEWDLLGRFKLLRGGQDDAQS